MGPDEEISEPSDATPHASSNPTQQVKARRRRGSLRKIALLGRGAQREQRESGDKVQYFDLSQKDEVSAETFPAPVSDIGAAPQRKHDALGLGVPDIAPPASIYISEASTSLPDSSPQSTKMVEERDSERVGSYNSTTDEDEVLQTPAGSVGDMSTSYGQESYFRGALEQRQRSFKHAKSPLSYSGLSSTAMPSSVSDWDYSGTEWWGWVVLCVTWFVFVIGMGSCLDVWSWAWDVGKTPYAPPELEDDPTLPIVGYYPTLIILTGVMAWVWVVVAWVGMKYFRHAKMSGD